MSNKKIRWIPIGIAAGMGIMLINNFLMKNNSETGVTEPEHNVYTTVITEKTIAPQIKGYGSVVAKNTWNAISEVQGKVTYINPKLQRGNFILADEVLIKIDPTSYQIALNKTQANLANAEAERDQLSIEKQRLEHALKIEQKNLALEERELTRMRSLKKKGSISTSELEKQQRAFYNKQLTVTDIHAQVNQLPFRFNALNAQIAQNQSQIEQAQLDLSHTEINMPFTGRIVEVFAELQQVVSVGEKLIHAQDISQLEIEAKVSTQQLVKLINSIKRNQPNFIRDSATPNIQDANLTAQILLRNANQDKQWQGRVTRIAGEVDDRIGTVGLVIEMDFDFLAYAKQDNPDSAPLVSGMFVEVIIDGYPQQQLTVPLSALHNDNLYLVTADKRLQIQPVEVIFIRNQTAVIAADNLTAQQAIVVSDVVPVANGLKLNPTTWSQGQ